MALVSGYHHLTMSTVSQKEDLSDPDVIHAFARHVGNERNLTALYLLTVADIRGTNPKLWNTWRASLLWQLYEATRRALRRGRSLPGPCREDRWRRPAW